VSSTICWNCAPHRGVDVHYGDFGDEDTTDRRPSKTRLKQQSHDLQDLGVAVAALPADRLAAIDMPDNLRDAIETYRRTRSHEGRRRQMQYVGKLMRSADEAALREAVAAATLGSAKETLALHEAERWRAELVASDDALTLDDRTPRHRHTATAQPGAPAAARRRGPGARSKRHIGIVSISDRASSGVYEDKGLPALQDWLTRALRNPVVVRRAG
jgi:ribosomal 50S subunit-associated protein YjgA (DUF615 family)